MKKHAVYLVVGACMLFMASNASADLVGHWPLDGDANDVSGNGLHGTILGEPSFVAGAVDLALDFDGVDDYVNIDGYKGIVVDPCDPDLIQPAFSITNWIKTTTSDGEMVTWGVSASKTKLGWRLNGGRLRIEHGGGALRANTYVNDDEWHHVALSVTEGGNLRATTTQMYVDGAEDTYFQGSDNPFQLSAVSDVRIGMSGPHDGRYFPGLIDDVRLYDHALSQADIRLQLGLFASYALTPLDGALIEDTTTTLSWTAGPVAASHNVYVGTNPEPGDAEFVVNQVEASYVVDALAQEQTYYWRIDDVEAAPEPNDPNAVIVHTGEVSSFTVPLMGAYDPNPADGQAIRGLERTLSWTPGWSPLMHAVYVGTDAAEVTSGAVAPTMLVRDASLNIDSLEPDTTYYWAVDEFYGDHWSVGSVWSLTTAPAVAIDPNADPNRVVLLDMDEAPGDLVVDRSGHGNHAEVMGGAQVVEGMDGMAMEFDGVDDYLDLGDNSVNGIFDIGGDAFTISAWINPSQFLPKLTNHAVGNVLFSRGSDSFNDNFELGIVDANLVLYTDTDGGDTTITLGSGEITVGEWHEVAVVYDAGAVTAIVDAAVYTGTVLGASFDQAAGSPFTIGDTLHEESPYSGLIDDVVIYNRPLTAVELGFVNLKQASEPIPADGEVVLSGVVGLIWTPGEDAVSHDIYLGMGDYAAVEAGGDTFVGNQSEASVVLGIGLPADPFEGGLIPGATYYWRIDEVAADGTTTAGKVWSFTLSE